MSKKSEHPFDEINELLGDPVLLQNEELDDYRNLEKKIIKILKPRNLLDMLDVRDIVNSIWEGKRFQDGAAQLIKAESRKAFKKVIDPKSGYIPDDEKSRKAVEDFEERPGDGMGKSILLRKLGIDESVVEAHAVLLAGSNYLIFEKLAAGRSAARRTGLKEFEKRQRVALKTERAEAKAKLKRQSKKKNDWDEEE